MPALAAWWGSGPRQCAAICGSCVPSPKEPLSPELRHSPMPVGYNNANVSRRQHEMGSCVRNKGAFVAGPAACGRFVSSALMRPSRAAHRSCVPGHSPARWLREALLYLQSCAHSLAACVARRCEAACVPCSAPRPGVAPGGLGQGWGRAR